MTNSSEERGVSTEMRRVDALTLDPENLKLHPEEQIASLVQSIRDYGFNDPVGITPEGDVIEGHGRIEAAKRVGMEEVPVLVVHGLTSAEKRAYAIAHNQTTMNTGLDNRKVAQELGALDATDEDWAATGFSSEDRMFIEMDAFDGQEPGAGFTDADAPEEPERTDHNGAARTNLSELLGDTVRTKVEFDDATQAQEFEDFIVASRTRYLTGGTIGARLMMFLDEYEARLDQGGETNGER